MCTIAPAAHKIGTAPLSNLSPLVERTLARGFRAVALRGTLLPALAATMALRSEARPLCPCGEREADVGAYCAECRADNERG